MGDESGSKKLLEESSEPIPPSSVYRPNPTLLATKAASQTESPRLHPTAAMILSIRHIAAQLQSSLWCAFIGAPVLTFAAEGLPCARGTMNGVETGLGKEDRIPGAPT